ncbi:unnamed protein product, partial [Closterium sp. Naga37s-1]
MWVFPAHPVLSSPHLHVGASTTSHTIPHAPSHPTCPIPSHMPHPIPHAPSHPTCPIPSHMPHPIPHAPSHPTCPIPSHMTRAVTPHQVGVAFDQLLEKLSLAIFTHFKQCAASRITRLLLSFLASHTHPFFCPTNVLSCFSAATCSTGPSCPQQQQQPWAWKGQSLTHPLAAAIPCFTPPHPLPNGAVPSHSPSHSKLLDKSFVAAAAAVGVGGRYSVTPCSYSGLLRQTHLQLLGRTVDMRDLLTQRLNKLTRHNLDYILVRMEGADLCHIMETHHLLDVLRGAHRLVAEHCPAIDSFEAIFTEATHSTSLSSLSSRTASYVCREVEQDVLPNFLWNATTRRFVRVASPLHMQQRPVQRPAVHLPSPEVYEAFMFGNKDLNEAYAHIALLHSQFIGQPHVDAVVALLGPHSLPMLLQFCLDSLSHK